ncbi:MAG: biotin/lipoate A/B protein ligase family protein [Dehalococcoidia bacterium]
MSKTTWRFVDGDWADGAYHMAVDEALLVLCAQERSPPTLRTYGFWPLCLSLGRFQSGQREVNRDQCRMRGIDVVRRPTGGRAVLHQNDLAYSVVAPADEPHVGGRLRETYQRIALALAEAMRLLGAPAVAVNDGPGFVPASGLCFQSLAPYDVTVAGAKVVGSAQVRRRGSILQHGSIRLMGGGHPLHRLMRLPLVVVRSQDSDVGLRELLGRRLTRRQVAAALQEAFAGVVGVELLPGGLTGEEEALAQRLQKEKYANPAWNWIR